MYLLTNIRTPDGKSFLFRGQAFRCGPNQYASEENRNGSTQINLTLSDQYGLQEIIKSVPLPPHVTEWYVDKCRKQDQGKGLFDERVCVDLTDKNIPNIASEYKEAAYRKQAETSVTRPTPPSRSVIGKKVSSTLSEIPHNGFP